jgi:hypothetical protein
MRIYFDTEFIVPERGGVMPTLFTIGLVKANGETYYAENGDCDITTANEWMLLNVVPHLTGPVKTKDQIAREVREFLAPDPELWAYYCTHDHMLLLDLLGGWAGTPEPARVCNELNTLFVTHGYAAEHMPKNPGHEHNALDDAQWVRHAYNYMRENF